MRPGAPTQWRIDRQRLQNAFEALAAIGATPDGGMHRLALSDADRDARDLLFSWCREAGYATRIDRLGSMFATRPGRRADRPPIMIGSHLDSQPHAGRFDGAVGVVAALEVMRSLDDRAVETEAPIQLVNWTNEEGARFRPPLLASGVFAGLYTVDFALARTDDAGKSVAEELARIGYDGAAEPGWPLTGYIEVHIEQGTVLERADAVIGVVSGVVGIRDIMVSVIGEDTHAGPLDMSLRRDALVGAAEMIVKANEIGLRHAPEARATVGRISVPSNSHSVVPGRAGFVLDLRHPEAAALEELEAETRAAFAAIAMARRLEVRLEEIWSYPPAHFDPTMQAAIRQAADAQNYPALTLPSRAGHDAWNVAQVAPAAMIFIPCRGGISHNVAEYAEFDHIAASADVLLSTVISVAGGC